MRPSGLLWLGIGSALAATLALSPLRAARAGEGDEAVSEVGKATDEGGSAAGEAGDAAGEGGIAVGEAGDAAVETVGNAVDEEMQGEESAASKKTSKKKKKTKKQEREEQKKFSVQPRTAKAFEKARQHLEAQQYAEAEAALGKLNLEKLSPHERAQAHRLYGYIAYGKQENDPAVDHLRQALVDVDALQPRDRADVLFQVAQIQAVEARWKDVVATLEAWFQVVEKPNSVGYFMLAMSHYQLGDLDAALAPARTAVEISKVPQQAWLQLLLAIYLTKQDYDSAKPVLDRMIAVYPNSGKDYWLQLSALHGVTGDDPRALGILELAYRKGLLTDDRDLRRLLQLMLARGVPHRAALIFEKEMEAKRFQDDSEALELLSISWILSREPSKALKPLGQAAELAKTGDLYVHIAQIHLLDEEWEEAVEVLRKALAKGGLKEPGTVHLMLGIAYYNEHRLQEARSWFAQAQRSGPTRRQAETWIQHVDREIEAERSTLGTGG